MSQAILQPSSADTFIVKANPTYNGNSEERILIGEDNAGADSINHSLIKFDNLSDGTIPSDATVTSATLSLYLYQDFANNSGTVEVYRSKRAWVESQATWNVYSTGNSWQTAGGTGSNDMEASNIGTVNTTASETTGAWKDITLTASAIQEIVAGTFTNNGFLLKTTAEDNDAYGYASNANSTSGNRPKLTVNYTVPSPSSSVSASPSLSPSVSVSASPSSSISSSVSPSSSISASESLSPSASLSASPSPTGSPSPSPSPSVSVSASISLSPSVSESRSPSSSVSASVSLSPSVSESLSMSVSVSPSPSRSISSSPSRSQSASNSRSVSPSISRSPSVSASLSASISDSVSPSAPISLYTREAKASLPSDKNDLATIYTTAEENDVYRNDEVYVPLTATATKYLIHQFKKLNDNVRDWIKVRVDLKSSLSCTDQPVYLQIWNHITEAWETIDSNSEKEANTDFSLYGLLTEDAFNDSIYYDFNNEFAARVYQLNNQGSQTLSIDLVQISFVISYADKYSSRSISYVQKYPHKNPQDDY